MEKVTGVDPKVSKDETGGLISVSWTCPHCGEYNAGFYFTPLTDEIVGDFEIDHECDRCGETVTIVCRGVGEL